MLRSVVQISQAHRSLAQEVIDRQIVEGTKKTYANNILHFTRWLVEHYPGCVEGEDEIILPLSTEVIMAYMASIQRRNEDGTPVQQGGKLIAVSTMTSIGSSIANLYRSRNVVQSDEQKLSVKNFMAGHRRMVSSAKQGGELPMFEGKRPLSFKGYELLAQQSLQMQNSRVGSLYPHLFIVLSWNLMSRSHSVASLMFNHFQWKGDAMLITVPQHKSDQEGTRIFPVHVYANPSKPEICPILALAIHVFSVQYHALPNGNSWKLFGGSKVEGKFRNWLQDLLKGNTFNDIQLGALKREIGTHSFR
jgi:hypothetical protein